MSCNGVGIISKGHNTSLASLFYMPSVFFSFFFFFLHYLNVYTSLYVCLWDSLQLLAPFVNKIKRRQDTNSSESTYNSVSP